MKKRELQFEVMRLRAQQDEARNKEVFGGLSSKEKADYDTMSDRIRELDSQLVAITLVDQASAAQRREWNERAETDNPQERQRQP